MVKSSIVKVAINSKVRVRVTEALQKFLNRREGSRSDRVSMIAYRYMDIVQLLVPAMSVQDWAVIAVAMANDSLSDLVAYEPEVIADRISTAEAIMGLGQRLNYDVADLVERVGRFTSAETVALIEALEQLVALMSEAEPGVTPEDLLPMLEQIGVRVAR